MKMDQNVTIAFDLRGNVWNNKKSDIPRSKIRKIVKFVRDELKKEGGMLIFDHQHEYLEDCDEPCYFSYEPYPMIKIATKNRNPKDWIPDLLHEFSHFEQWRDDTQEWRACFIDDIDVSILADLWVKGWIDFPDGIRLTIFNSLTWLEFQAEKRTLQWFDEFELNPYTQGYAQKANAYVLSYQATKKIRQWIPRVYEYDPVVKQQPSVLVTPINLDIKTFMKVFPAYQWDMFESKIPEKEGFWARLFNW